MKLARFGPPGQEKPGLLGPDGRIHDLSEELRGVMPSRAGLPLDRTTLEKIAGLAPEDLPPAPEGVRIGCCIADAPNIYGVGLNYEDRLVEGLEPPLDAPVFFSKATSALAGPFDGLSLPAGAAHVDFEVELAVIIARDGYRIPEWQAFDHVAGYALANDLSERTMQAAPGGQWFAGKSLPGFAPLGPWLVTADEIENPQALRLRSELNGEEMQASSTADMLFSVAELISHLSHLLALRAGDVLLTGTPFGYGLDRTPPRFLTAGDRLVLSGGPDRADGDDWYSGAEGLGRQITSVGLEKPPGA